MPKNNPVGYLVSGSRNKSGKVFRTLPQAKKEMGRQMRARSRTSGIMEISNERDYKTFSKTKYKKLAW